MRTLKILTVSYVIIGLCLESAQGQSAQKISYPELSGIGSIAQGKPDTTIGSVNASGSASCLPDWMRLTNKMSVPFIANNNSYDFLYRPISVNGTTDKLSEKSGSITSDGIGGNFNSKWERLTGKPISDTTTTYFYLLKSTNAPSLTNSPLYRISANIFNMTMNSIYPRAYTPQKYPQAYDPPK